MYLKIIELYEVCKRNLFVQIKSFCSHLNKLKVSSFETEVENLEMKDSRY
jgi:hypothetical protein